MLSGRGYDGHASQFRRERGELFVRLHEELGDAGVFRIFGFPLLSLASPELIHEVFIEKARLFEKSLALRIAFYPLAGTGLFTAEGDLWRTQRRRMAPLFHPAPVKTYESAMTDVIDRCMSTWRDGDVIDAGKEMTRITMAVVGKVLFDAETFDEADEIGAAITVMFNYLADMGGSLSLTLRAAGLSLLLGLDDLPEWAVRARERIVDLTMSPHKWPLLPQSKRLAHAVETMDSGITRMIAERRRSTLAKDDVLSRILQARDEDGSRMSDKQIRDEAVTLFVAGHETTATSTTWSLYFLSRHPEIYRRYKAEVASLGGRLSPGDTEKLTYTTGVLKEALRFYPPAFLLDRVATEDTTIGNYELPAQAFVAISPYALHRRPALWPNPLRFDPERFTPAAEAARPRLAWLPFGAGPRVCIGAQFAMQEGLLVLARMAQRFDFEPLDHAPIGPSYATALRPARPVMLRLRAA